ncbi:MAG: phosphotransferase family protein [Ornithinibacter sp.]
MDAGGRSARLVLVHHGTVAGALPPLQLEMPWWPETHDVVAAAREHFGIDVVVLRLLETRSDHPFGGAVTYLAETDRLPGIRLEPWPAEVLADEPLRAPWARPGGPEMLLRWADEQLGARGMERVGPAQQMRSWNLSALWRLPTGEGPVWLKAVPGFFAHEGDVIDWIGSPPGPRLVAHVPGRVLMAEARGAPNHGTRGPALEPMVQLLTRLQERAAQQTQELLAIGVPDRRLRRMVRRIESVTEEWAGSVDPNERRALAVLVADLPRRLARIDECGVPDTLVHGDFHPGNVVGEPGAHVLIDWGDSFVGHPLIDELAFTQRLDAPDRAVARQWFVGAWRRIAPEADPERAAALLRPVLPLLAAVMYADFCAGIEPDERVYHHSDVGRMLQQAVTESRPGHH